MIELSKFATIVGNLLVQRGETVSVAESSTGGLISAALLAVPGASAYFVGGTVVYTKPARDTFLKIDSDKLHGIRSATEPYALLLAQSTRESLTTTWGLSESVAAGPTGNRYGDDPGHTCIAVSGPWNCAKTFESGVQSREANMQSFAEQALKLFELALTRS